MRDTSQRVAQGPSVSDEASPPGAGTARSIERAFDILTVLRESRSPMTLSEIARKSGNHLATTQRIVNVLVRSGYATQERSGYAIGVMSLLNSYSYLLSNTLVQISLPVIQELASVTGFFASLAVRVELKQILLLRVEGKEPLRYQLPDGERYPLHLGAARVLAAALDETELRTLLADIPEIRLASGEVLTHEQFREDLRVIREQGHAISNGQRLVGSMSVAVPLLGQDDQVIASIYVAARAEKWTPEIVERCLVELKLASASITKRLA